VCVCVYTRARVCVDVGWEDVDRLYLAQDRTRWQAFVYMVMNFWVP
jgi:hypothetical protein